MESLTSVFGCNSAILRAKSRESSIFSPFTATMTSPGLRSSLAAGPSSVTLVTIAPLASGMPIDSARAQMQLRLQLGLGKIEAETLVFSTIEGNPLSPDNLSRDWRRFCASKRLPRVSFHSLRHTHASVLIASGVDILAVSRLGHSRASTTLNVYGHVLHGA